MLSIYKDPSKCQKQRVRQERIYKRPNRGPFKKDCGQIPTEPYKVHINIDPATRPCAAVSQLIKEEIRFGDRCFTGQHCPTKRINKVSKTHSQQYLQFLGYSLLLSINNFQVNRRMLTWKNKLHEKLGCSIPDLVVKADATAGPQFCRDRAADIQQTFKPLGSLVADSSRMVYEAESESSGHTWYFYEMESGEWEFTWESWLTPGTITPGEYGTRKLKSINETK